MAIIYCNDGGSNTSPYETLAKAATTFLVAVDAASAGDDIYIGMDHSETPGTVTYTFPGTDSSPNRVISINTTTENYDKADNIQVDNSAANNSITINGHVTFFGVSLKSGDDFNFFTGGDKVIFCDSVLEVDRTSGSQIRLGTNGIHVEVILINTDFNISNSNASAGISLNGGIFKWLGGTLTLGGTQPTTLFIGLGRTNLVSIAGVDLSAATNDLIDVSPAFSLKLELQNCRLGVGTALTTGSISHTGITALMSGCDDSTGNDLYRLEYVDFWGSTVHDDVIFRDSGASDGTTNISWKMVSTGNALEFSEPTKSPPIVAWVDSTGAKTFTVHLNFDSATDLDDDEVWLEIEYLEASADTDSAFADDRTSDIKASIDGSASAQATSTEAWTGTGGFTNENKQQLDVAATVNRVGPVIARVCLAKPSTTIYVDPKIEIA